MPKQLFPDFPKKGIVCAVSPRRYGNMSFTYGDTKGALANRKKFLGEMGIDYSALVCGRQTHSDGIKHARGKDRGSGAISCDNAVKNTDAFITDEPNLPLAVFTADCLSIFLYDPATPAIGIVHAGWKSSAKMIAAKTVRLMRKKFKSDPRKMLVSFGPAIRNCCYEVGDDFRERFPGGAIRRGEKFYLDLPKINREQLLREGVRKRNIFDPGGCTFCGNKRFFSFRKEGDRSGRMMSVISLTV